MNHIRKYAASLILVFALLAINGSELFHHHSDAGTNTENQCSVCILVKSVHNTIAVKTFSGLPLPVFFNPFSDSFNSQYSFSTEEHSSSRAPPPVSHS